MDLQFRERYWTYLAALYLSESIVLWGQRKGTQTNTKNDTGMANNRSIDDALETKRKRSCFT